MHHVGRPRELLAQRERPARQEGETQVVVLARAPRAGVDLGREKKSLFSKKYTGTALPGKSSATSAPTSPRGRHQPRARPQRAHSPIRFTEP